MSNITTTRNGELVKSGGIAHDAKVFVAGVVAFPVAGVALSVIGALPGLLTIAAVLLVVFALFKVLN